MPVRFIPLIALIGVGALASGCSSTQSAKQILAPDPPGKMYARADGYLTAGRFEKAAKKFEDLDRDHPYAPEARRAMVMAAYAYMKAGKSPEAIATARRYTTMHPGTKDAPLAHHIIATSYFSNINGPNRDQSATRKALKEYRVLKTRYPNSKYAVEADNRIRIAEDSPAAAEMNVGRYYLKRNNHVAAINRFKTVVRDYQTTQHVEEALMRLTEAYMALGIRDEAQTAVAILGHNFPNSRWYQDAYALLQSDGLAPRNVGGSWLSRTFANFKMPRLFQ